MCDRVKFVFLHFWWQEEEEDEAPKIEKTAFTLKLVEFGEGKKIGLIKELKTLIPDMNLVKVMYNKLVWKFSHYQFTGKLLSIVICNLKKKNHTLVFSSKGKKYY